MAIQIELHSSFSPHIINQSFPFRKPIFEKVVLRKTPLPVNKTAKLQIRSSIRDLVYEDQSAGIICYKDDRGEIICEGFDEGPRLLPHSTPLPCLVDDTSIIDQLQQRWLQIMNWKSTANSSSSLEEQHSCN